MVCAENEKSSADEQFHFLYKHSLQMGRVSPFSPVSKIEAMSADMDLCSSGGMENCEFQFGERSAFGSPLDANIRNPRDTDDPSTSTYTSANLDSGPFCFDMEINPGKRNNHSDDVHALGFKRARQDNFSSGLTYQLKDSEADGMTKQLFGREARVFSSEPVSTVMGSPVDARDASGIEGFDVNNSRSNITGISVNKQNDVSFVLPEVPTEISFLPQCMDRSHLSKESDPGDSMLSPFFDNYFRKPVLMGPNHQVDVPPMDSNNIVNYDAKSSDKFVGTCILPMPDTDDSLTISIVEFDNDVSNCCCSDNGSIRCVKQHVTEARVRVKIMFGLEKFTQLGFCDMGEDVAKGWSVEDEQLFNEVILANPASDGKNFWNILPWLFTTRDSKELVSYYFNVFMLRKRADQNRLDPLNADSDNDEWQDGDDGHHIMDGAGECSHRSAIYKDYHVADHEEDHGSSDEEDNNESCDDYDVVSGSTEQGLPNLCNGHVDGYNEDDSDEEFFVHFARVTRDESGDVNGSPHSINAYKSCFGPSELTSKRNTQHMNDNDARDDDSGTLFDGRNDGVYTSGEHKSFTAATEIRDLSVCKNVQECKTSLDVASEPNYYSGHCDSKTWDIGYIGGSGDVIEFLPTCHVLEEVFGQGNCENDTKDGPTIM